MADKRIPVLAPDPETGRLRFATVNESEAHIVEKSGGRVLSAKEALQQQQQIDYDKKGTGEKIAGAVVGTATGPIVGNALAGTGTISVSPEMQAFQQGEAAALTGGLDQVAVMKALEATAGKEAARVYGKNQLQIAEANSGWKTAGEFTGFAATALSGSAGGAARALPGMGIQALGAGAENLAARALSGVAARGVAGRAVATAAELGVRGGVEATLYGAAHGATESILGDPDVTADKVFAAAGMNALHALPYGVAGGAIMGGAGSLAKSAVVGTGRAVSGGLSRVLGRAEEARNAVQGAAEEVAGKAQIVADAAPGIAKAAADDAGNAIATAGKRAQLTAQNAVADAADGAQSLARKTADATGTKAAQEAGTARGLLSELSTAEGQKGIAYDLAFDAIGRGNGLQTTRFAGKAQRYLPNGTRDVGEILVRKGIVDVDGGLLNAAKNGTAEDMLPKITSERAINAQKLAEMTSMNPARVTDREIEAAVEKIAKVYDGKAGQKNIAKAVRDYGLDLRQTLGTAAEGPRSGLVLRTGRDVSVQELVDQRKALDELVFKEVKALDPNMRVDALRDLRREIEGIVVDSFERAGAGLEGNAKVAYQALKRDHVALSIAEELATDSAMRNAKGATLGLRDMLAGGGGMKGMAFAFAHKAVRERGSAAAAVLIHRMSDLGTITKAVQTLNGQIEAASKGLLVPPKRAPLPEMPTGTVRERAERTMRQVAEWQADPQGFVDKVASSTEGLSVSAPELAGRVTQRMTDAFAFLASKMPTAPPPDPFNPRGAPHLTDNEAAKLSRYAWYVDKPSRFFDELSHGKLTFEGLEVCKALMPGAFAELQQRTAEGLATLAAQGRTPPYQQRVALGSLLEFPAVPAQRPEHAQFLQKNVLRSMQSAQTGPAPRPSSSKPAQRSALDRLESGGPGR